MRDDLKVIFTDFDGVLNSSKWDRQQGPMPLTDDPRDDAEWNLEPERVALLKQAVDRSQAKLVVSSSWRGDGHGIAMLRHAGLDAIGETPRIRVTGRAVWARADEIRAWLQEHPEVDSFVVLDDDYVDLPDQLIRVHGMLGLQQVHVDDIVARLGG